MKRFNSFILYVIFIIIVFSGCSSSKASGQPEEIRLDYAYYSPTSLVLKEYGWLEEALKDEAIEVKWVLSHGSNKALEFLNSNSIDFGSTAGAAAFLSKINGAPIRNVYITNQPEWTALVAVDGSPIQSVHDLIGKKVAATLGTDPHIFLLRALYESDIAPNEVEIVNLQHSDGATSLTTGAVDAWAGLDPHMARLEVETDAKLFYRNIDFNTYGFLNVHESFLEKYPEYVEIVLEAYEKARKWVLENPEEAIEILAKEAEIPLEVAQLQFERNRFDHNIPGAVQIEALIESGKVLKASGLVEDDVDIEKIANDLVDPSVAGNILKE